jgi:hypothetical protein
MHIDSADGIKEIYEAFVLSSTLTRLIDREDFSACEIFSRHSKIFENYLENVDMELVACNEFRVFQYNAETISQYP